MGSPRSGADRFLLLRIAIAFPSGSPACGIAYASTGYKLSETFKFTLPFIVLAVISIVLSANFFCPIYG